MRDRRARLANILFVCIMLCMGMFTACSEPEPFPDVLTGIWVTDAPQYEGRSIEISRDQLIFGTGETMPNIFFINKFKSTPDRNSIQWVFDCEIRRGEPFEFVVIFHPDKDDPWFELKNYPRIRWYRQAD